MHSATRRGRGGNWAFLGDFALNVCNLAEDNSVQTASFSLFHHHRILSTQHIQYLVPDM